jgi:hypothetical protein
MVERRVVGVSGSQLGIIALDEHLGGLLDGLGANTTHFDGC